MGGFHSLWTLGGGSPFWGGRGVRSSRACFSRFSQKPLEPKPTPPTPHPPLPRPHPCSGRQTGQQKGAWQCSQREAGGRAAAASWAECLVALCRPWHGGRLRRGLPATLWVLPSASSSHSNPGRREGCGAWSAAPLAQCRVSGLSDRGPGSGSQALPGTSPLQPHRPGALSSQLPGDSEARPGTLTVQTAPCPNL